MDLSARFLKSMHWTGEWNSSNVYSYMDFVNVFNRLYCSRKNDNIAQVTDNRFWYKIESCTPTRRSLSAIHANQRLAQARARTERNERLRRRQFEEKVAVNSVISLLGLNENADHRLEEDIEDMYATTTAT